MSGLDNTPQWGRQAGVQDTETGEVRYRDSGRPRWVPIYDPSPPPPPPANNVPQIIGAIAAVLLAIVAAFVILAVVNRPPLPPCPYSQSVCDEKARADLKDDSADRAARRTADSEGRSNAHTERMEEIAAEKAKAFSRDNAEIARKQQEAQTDDALRAQQAALMDRTRRTPVYVPGAQGGPFFFGPGARRQGQGGPGGFRGPQGGGQAQRLAGGRCRMGGDHAGEIGYDWGGGCHHQPPGGGTPASY